MDLPPSVHRPDEVRGIADRILAASRYDRPPKSIPDRIVEWFSGQLSRVIGSLVAGGAGTLVAWAFVLIVLALVVYLVVRFGRFSGLARAAVPTSRVMVELTETPAEWRRQAEALEAAGRWNEGLRCRHRALIADLVRRGTLSDQPGRTAGEYVTEVSLRMPEASPALAAATELFEAAWYGGAVSGPDEAARFRALDARVLATLVHA